MENTNAVQVASQSQVMQTLDTKAVVDQIALIQNIMKSAMKVDEHYGVIPGCGKKPTLLKAGAEKLSLTFRLAPSYKVERFEMDRGHREYEVVCILTHIPTGNICGQGVGSCSTMESKYRFRTGATEDTGMLVPQDYWTLRKDEPEKAQELIGGKGRTTKKVDGQWHVFIQGEKCENDNPADQYNTVLKMAKKRAYIDAMLSATAASDIFTQDIEELVENGVITPAQTAANVPPKAEDKKPTVHAPTPAKQEPPPKTQAQDAEYTAIPQDIPTVEGTLEDVQVKSGGTDKKPWTRYGLLIDGMTIGTFDKTLGEKAKTLIGEPVKVVYSQEGKFHNLISISPVLNAPVSEEPLPGEEDNKAA